jgi:RHS repeat-associated protein
MSELTDSTWTNYLWFDGELVGLARNGQLNVVHTDHLGRPDFVTNAGRQTVWKAYNYAYGRSLQQDDIGGLNIGFPGQYHDAESGLWYNGFRDYDASIARYVQSDPIGSSGGLNSYAYVMGNPINFVDSLGLATVDLGNGFWGRVDTFNYGGNASFEIHVYNSKGVEAGVYGPDGWLNKHGHKGAPNGLPDGVEAQCKTISDDYSRRAGITARRASQRASRLKSFFKGWPLIGPLIEMTAPSPDRVCENIPGYPECEAM